MNGIITIGEKIRSLRQLRGYSQDNVASMLGISLNAYSKIECGETDVTWSRLMQLSHIFELPAAELIQFGEKPFFHFKTLQNTPEPKALWQELEHLRSSYVQKEREAQHLQRIISLLEEKIG